MSELCSALGKGKHISDTLPIILYLISSNDGQGANQNHTGELYKYYQFTFNKLGVRIQRGSRRYRGIYVEC